MRIKIEYEKKAQNYDKNEKSELNKIRIDNARNQESSWCQPVAKGDIGDCRYGNIYGANNDDKAAPRLF